MFVSRNRFAWPPPPRLRLSRDPRGSLPHRAARRAPRGGRGCAAGGRGAAARGRRAAAPGGCGDWATNAARVQLARGAGLRSRRVAEVLRERLLDEPGIERVDITGPGFLNLTLRSAARGGADRALVRRILAQGPAYGHGDALRDEDRTSSVRRTAPPTGARSGSGSSATRSPRSCGRRAGASGTAPTRSGSPCGPPTTTSRCPRARRGAVGAAPARPPRPRAGAGRAAAADRGQPSSWCGTPTPGPAPCSATPGIWGSTPRSRAGRRRQPSRRPGRRPGQWPSRRCGRRSSRRRGR